MATAIHYAGWIDIPYASRGTYDELVSTGNLGLLRNAQLKSEIANYYAKPSTGAANGIGCCVTSRATIGRDRRRLATPRPPGSGPRDRADNISR